MAKRIVIDMPDGTEQYAGALKRFVDYMVYKLRKNAHKGRWEGMTIPQCFPLLRGEVKELQTAVREKNTAEIMTEAADVANFAMIIATIATEE